MYGQTVDDTMANGRIASMCELCAYAYACLKIQSNENTIISFVPAPWKLRACLCEYGVYIFISLHGRRMFVSAFVRMRVLLLCVLSTSIHSLALAHFYVQGCMQGFVCAYTYYNEVANARYNPNY